MVTFTKIVFRHLDFVRCSNTFRSSASSGLHFHARGSTGPCCVGEHKTIRPTLGSRGCIYSRPQQRQHNASPTWRHTSQRQHPCVRPSATPSASVRARCSPVRRMVPAPDAARTMERIGMSCRRSATVSQKAHSGPVMHRRILFKSVSNRPHPVETAPPWLRRMTSDPVGTAPYRPRRMSSDSVGTTPYRPRRETCYIHIHKVSHPYHPRASGCKLVKPLWLRRASAC